MSANQRASEDLGLKLRFEARMKPHLTRWFRSVGRDIRLHWAVHRTLPDFNHYTKSMEAILLEQYKLVSKYFSTRTRAHLAKKYGQLEFKKTDEEKERDDIILMALFLYGRVRAEEQSRLIVNTTATRAQNISGRVVSGSVVQTPPLTKQEEAKEIQAEFNAETPGRVDAIAVTETQGMAEKSKLVEAGVMATALANTDKPQAVGVPDESSPLGVSYPDGEKPKGIFKTWKTILDSRTREHHVEADGQRVLINKYFDVMGENLMFPGDTSYASAKNIVNCRCSAVYDDG